MDLSTLVRLGCQGIKRGVTRGLLFGFFLGAVFSFQLNEANLHLVLFGCLVTVLASVESMPVISDRSTRFIATLIPQPRQPLPKPVARFFSQKFSGRLVSHPRKVRLSWYHSLQLSPGQRWLMTIRLRRPRGFVNPRGFDYQAWFLPENCLLPPQTKRAVIQK